MICPPQPNSDCFCRTLRVESGIGTGDRVMYADDEGHILPMPRGAVGDYLVFGNGGILTTAPGTSVAAHEIADSAHLGPEHTTHGLTVGHILTAIAPDDAAFQAFPLNDDFVWGGLHTFNQTTVINNDLYIESDLDPCIYIDSFSTKASTFIGRKANGPVGAPTKALTGDTLAAFSGRGYGATNYGANSVGSIRIIASQDYTDTAQGTYMIFQTTPNGSVVRATRLILSKDGDLYPGADNTYMLGTDVAAWKEFYVYSANIDSLGIGGVAPVSRQAHVANPAGGAVQDAEARSAINAILGTLETFGFHNTL